MMDFVFESSPWEQALENLQPGDTINALTLLTLLEDADEDTAQEVLDELEQKNVALVIDDLPNLPTGGNMTLRLRQEAQLVASSKLPDGLEENDPLRLYLEELASTPAAGDTECAAYGLDSGGQHGPVAEYSELHRRRFHDPSGLVDQTVSAQSHFSAGPFRRFGTEAAAGNGGLPGYGSETAD